MKGVCVAFSKPTYKGSGCLLRRLGFLVLALAFATTETLVSRQYRRQDPRTVMGRYQRLWRSSQTIDYGHCTPQEEILIRQLASSEPLDRWNAAKELSSRGAQHAVPWIILAMQDDRGTRRTCVMAQALGGLQDARSVPALIEALNHPTNEDLRYCAAKALGQIGDERGVQALVDAYESEQLSLAALTPIAQIGGIQAERFIQKIEQAGDGPLERSIASRGRRMMDARKQQNNSDLLNELLKTAHGEERRWLVDLMARNGQPDAVPFLAQLIADDAEDADIRGCAAAGLVLIGKSALEVLSDLKNGNSEAAANIASAIAIRISEEAMQYNDNSRLAKAM